jgi:hypothetical protein
MVTFKDPLNLEFHLSNVLSSYLTENMSHFTSTSRSLLHKKRLLFIVGMVQKCTVFNVKNRRCI